MSWKGWPHSGGRQDDRYGNKGRSWQEDDGGGTGGSREKFTEVSSKGPGRTRDVVEHAWQVQKDLSSKGMENKRRAEQKDHDDYVNQLQHRVLDHLAAWEGEDFLSSFMCQVHVDDRAYHTSQKAIKNFVEEYLDDVVEVFRSPGEANGQYSFRMRTVEKGKGKNHGKRDDQRPSKSRRRGGRGRSNTPEEEDEPASIRLEVDAAVEDAADFDASGIELPEGQMDACGVFEGDVVEVSGAKGAHTLCVVKQREEDGDACALGRLARQNAAARV